MKRNASNGSHASDDKGSPRNRAHSQSSKQFLPPRGNYHILLGFHKAEVIYDITFRFAHKYLSKGDRTIDQMIQAARSGKKNLLEGSKAGLTSRRQKSN